MEHRRLGKTGLEVSVIGFGGAETGYAGTDAATVERVIANGIDAGVNVVDTAECYGNGEETIGKALVGRRDKVLLFTKCGHASGFDLPDWDPKMLEMSIDRSLARLGTDHVDVLFLHSCGEDVLRHGDAIAVAKKAQAAGKTRFIGYSGDRIDAVFAIDTDAFDVLQTSISIADQEAIGLLLPRAADRDMGVVAKRSIANGAWTYGDTPPSNGYYLPYWERLQKLDYDFLREPVRAPSVAVRFPLSIPGVHMALIGTMNPYRLKENANLLAAGMLTPAEVMAIRIHWRESGGESWAGQR